MSNEACARCGSYAINHHSHGRDGSDGDLCDVCYWRKRAEQPDMARDLVPRRLDRAVRMMHDLGIRASSCQWDSGIGMAMRGHPHWLIALNLGLGREVAEHWGAPSAALGTHYSAGLHALGMLPS